MAPKSKPRNAGQLPARYLKFQKSFRKVFEAYDALGAAIQSAGPLTVKERALVKLAIAVGARLEGGVHSHTRRARAAGCTADEIRHVPLLATTTIGFLGMPTCLFNRH